MYQGKGQVTILSLNSSSEKTCKIQTKSKVVLFSFVSGIHLLILCAASLDVISFPMTCSNIFTSTIPVQFVIEKAAELRSVSKLQKSAG